MSQNKPLLLIIFDGWGVSAPSHGNAISLAKKPYFDKLTALYPTMTLQASGEVVGLTWGEMGNSEVGHLTMGAGRIIYQSLARVSKSIIDGNFQSNKALLIAIKHVKENKSSLHVMGLVSNGGVHSHQDHLYAILDLCKSERLEKVFIHVFLDGRDTQKDEGLSFIKSLQQKIKETGVGKIATISGRFYAMDRDNHWERIEKAYNAMVEGKSEKKYEDPIQAIKDSYDAHIYDEEFEPVVITEKGKPLERISDNDSLIFFNFRPDRARQITSAFVLPGFEKFEKKKYFSNLSFVAFTKYDKSFPMEVAFPPIETNNTLAQVISENNLKQLRIAETEKYAHVTYFFNGGQEKALPNEDRILVPSPMVASYDTKPEMSAYEVTNRALKEIGKNIYDFITINFANADMVGHTGNLEATIKAVQVLDECLEKLTEAVIARDGTVIITADHGNAEYKVNLESGEIMKEHTKNPIPFIIVNKRWQQSQVNSGGSLQNVDLSMLTPSGMLSDVAPTILKIMNLPIPKDMMGNSLI